MAGIGVDVGVKHDDVGEAEHGVVGGFVHGVAPLAVGVVLLHLVGVGGSVIDKAGLVGRAVLDLDILAVADHGAVLVAVGAVQAVGQVAGFAGTVVHKVEEGGVVGAVHIYAVVVDVLLDVLRVGVHRVFQRQVVVVVGGTGPVDAVVIAVAVGAVVVVQVAVAVVDGILLHDDGLALVDIQRLPGQDQAEELVTAGTHGAHFADVLVVGEHRHKAGDAALDLDLKQNVRLGQAALGAGRHNVVDHHGGDALVLVVVALGLTGEHVGQVRFLGRFRRSGGFRCGGGRAHGVPSLFLASREHNAQRQDGHDEQKLTFHSQFLFSHKNPSGRRGAHRLLPTIS